MAIPFACTTFGLRPKDGGAQEYTKKSEFFFVYSIRLHYLCNKYNTCMKSIRWVFALLLCLAILTSCQQKERGGQGKLEDVALRYATNLTLQRGEHYIVATLANPWKAGETLQTYVLLDSTLSEAPAEAPKGVVVHVPLRRSIVFTTAHASLLEMLGRQQTLRGVADAQYMLLPFVHRAIRDGRIADCGSAMQPSLERLIAAHGDALLLSPFEGASFGQLAKAGIPIILCADYMETSALGRAEWMKFYGMLFGAEAEADSLFNMVEHEYKALKERAAGAKQTLSVLPDRRVGQTWYVPGGHSSVGMLYRDAAGRYAYAADTHSGSLSLPFETILQRFGEADVWLLSYQGALTRASLLAEYHGYAKLKPFQTGEIYGCKVDERPYFEQVSWRPDWLLDDLIQLFHPDLRSGTLRYYAKIE